MNLVQELKKLVRGDVEGYEATLEKYSRDASIFRVRPRAVVFPRDIEDIKKLVQFVNENKKNEPSLSLTARSAGTDMTGGPLNESIIVDVTRYLNRIIKLTENYVVAEPGVMYRDLEKEAMEFGVFLPSYPASKGICALGGMVANNSGGEKSLVYGKTEKFVEELKVVLADANEYTIRKITKAELAQKKRQKNFEGEFYRRIFSLLESNYALAKSARPDVSKNSSGYNIWDVWDGEYFDLVKLFIGSQGTFGVIVQIKFHLEKIKLETGMAIIYTKSLVPIAQLVRVILPLKPSSFESFDDHTLKLALKFLSGFLKILGARNFFGLLWKFLPDFWTILTFGMPKMIFLVEFEGENKQEIEGKLQQIKDKLKNFSVRVRIAKDKEQAQKYWAIRRESFNLLRQRIQGKQTVPFIDDFVVKPDRLSEFLPKIYRILDKYHLLYTIAGHAGEGNFHIIPLMNLVDPNERRKIPAVAAEIYKLVLENRGSMSGEHNDGIVRSPYLQKMFGEAVYRIFQDVKNIFDPLNIFNPGKKVGASLEYAAKHIKEANSI